MIATADRTWSKLLHILLALTLAATVVVLTPRPAAAHAGCAVPQPAATGALGAVLTFVNVFSSFLSSEAACDDDAMRQKQAEMGELPEGWVAPDMSGYAVHNDGSDRYAPCVDGVAYVPELDGHPILGTGAFPCDNVDLLSFFTNDEIGGSLVVGDGRGSEVWGWEDPETGREYAIVGLEVGTSFIDITEPRSPIYLAHLPTSATDNLIWRDIKVYKDHAFIVAESANHGMQVVDLAKLRGLDRSSAPHTITHDARYTGFLRAHTIAINEDTGIAFAAGQRNDARGCASTLHIMDVNDPLDPTYVGCYNHNGYVHDTHCVTYDGPDGRYSGREICVNSNPSTPGIGNAVVISDVTDKATPVTVSRLGYPGSAYSHQGWLLDGHRYYLHNSESTSRSPQRVDIFDLGDLENPQHIGSYVNPAQSTHHNLYQRGRFVYQSNYTSGLRIYDVQDVGEGTIEEIGFFDVYPPHDDMGFALGTWGNYPYYRSGVVAVHGYQGFFLVDPRLPTFDMLSSGLDDLVAAGGINPSLEAKIRHAISQTEAWLARPQQRPIAHTHIQRAINLLLWQADVVDRTGKTNQGDPAGLRALAELFQEKLEDLVNAP